MSFAVKTGDTLRVRVSVTKQESAAPVDLTDVDIRSELRWKGESFEFEVVRVDDVAGLFELLAKADATRAWNTDPNATFDVRFEHAGEAIHSDTQRLKIARSVTREEESA